MLVALLLAVLKILASTAIIIIGAIDSSIALINFSTVVFSVLTVFVLIDLIKTFVDYREHERIRLTFLTDATILIVMREIAAGIYAQKIEYEFILSLSVLLMVLGAIRIMATKYPPHDSCSVSDSSE
ncbi:uncharacterized membrane protein (DUF373 family) [Methanohalophilus levihalophilus]|uniref:phosphate-starvation-inducible PsiE family protein n=1 Tax=Methanohalophilus levihalophilus TaxID=1431282 RepID=UPI001FD8CA0E|nr:uncharacterized membrane protein (DUF373 family) [Methanohalophilus levihalophilus]